MPNRSGPGVFDLIIGGTWRGGGPSWLKRKARDHGSSRSRGNARRAASADAAPGARGRSGTAGLGRAGLTGGAGAAGGYRRLAARALMALVLASVPARAGFAQAVDIAPLRSPPVPQ